MRNSLTWPAVKTGKKDILSTRRDGSRDIRVFFQTLRYGICAGSIPLISIIPVFLKREQKWKTDVVLSNRLHRYNLFDSRDAQIHARVYIR
ncbi:hypothetical protein CXT94_10230 [Akkermansia muciniphila]|nr:hypothetical protein CXT94_10230 [Akkermansia muciniphila]